MNKIYKVMYSKVKQCCVVVSEIAKSHGHNGESSGVRKHAALTAAVLLALGSLSFTTAFVPMTAEAADKTRTDGSNFVGVERTNGLIDESKYENSGGKGAQGADSITLGLHAQAGAGTITIGDRRSSASMGSVYVGHGDIANPELDTGGWVTSIGYNSDATGYGSIALGSNAVAKNFYAKDSKGNSLKLNDDTKFRLNPKPDIQRASVAIGYGASADNGNIAIGSYSDASTDLRTAKTKDGKEIKSYLTDKMADSYVSVGDGKDHSETQYRRISNVADGASASDVATVGQLQALSAKVGVYDAGFGIVIDSDKDNKKNTISLNRKLGTNLDKTGHVYLDVSDTGLVLGTVVDGASGTDMDLHYGATGDYAVTVGGGANTASGKASVVLGGSLNKASNEATVASGGSSNVASGSMAAVYGGFDNEASEAYATILGGAQNKASNTWTAVGGGALNEASGKYASVWGGYHNKATDDSAAVYGGLGNSAYGSYSAILGGGSNKAGGAAVVSGGASNEAAGVESAVLGGVGNIVTGANATAVGGVKGSVNGVGSVGILGGSTGTNAPFTLAAGYQSTVTDTGVTSTPITEEEAEKFQEEGTHPGLLVGSNDPDNLSFKILDHFATAVGYQATADEAQTVAFGHDKGDTYYGTTTYTWKQKATIKDGHYYDEYGSEINEDDYKSLMNADGTWNDYSQPIATVEEKKYDSAYYNRLVKAADGIEDHDAVVMEQLKNASDVGSKIKVYKTDKNGNVQFDKNNNPIEDTSAEAETKKTAAQKASEDAWGSAIGTGKVVDPNAKDKDSNGSGQLVTGGTVYNALQQQKTDLTDALTVKPGWGIEKTDDNTISVKHNLSTGDSAYAAAAYADSEAKGLILGGSTRDRIAGKKYGATTKTSVIVGARDALASNDNTVVIGGEENIASGESTTVVGGLSNTASGQGYSAAASVFGGSFNIANGLCSVVLGGIENVANNDYSTNSGGVENVVFGSGSINSGGLKNVVYANNASSFGGVAAAVNGEYSTGIAGGSTARNAQLSFAAGFQSVVTDSGVRKTVITRDEYERKWSEQTRELGPVQAGYNPITNKYEQYDKISTALGYQATADEPGTIAFGHDAGDESGYTYEWETLTDENGNPKKNDIDYTTNDYTKPPKSVNEKDPYTSSYYNRLVKVADGIDDHDVVVMEQLKNASDVGNNIKVYKTDENGNVQFDENNKPIEDRSDAAKTKQKDSKDAWGKALGAGTFTTGTDTTPTNASTSYQLVTGKTLYDYDKPTGSQNYVNVNSTTGQNLSALDTQVKANTDALTKPNHNIKYYAVDETTLPKLTNFNGKDYSNEKNNGAVGMGSIAAGFNTHADGIASTVAGSYSGVINSKTGDLRGATALSYGTFNVNKNTDSTKAVSGVANSIIGQANVTTDSNAAIIYGAGNTVTNSYRDIDTSKVNLNKVKQDLKNKDVAAVIQDAQKAVPTSGGQVMVMGGGNNVESAYMTQVVGVGNTVKGNQVKNDKGEWVTDTSDTAIKDYDEKKSSHYNYVDGFNNDVINGKHDYIIGANNKLDGDSYDDNNAKPIKRSNKSNVVIGDNHALTGKKNNVIIGSADTEGTLTRASDAVIIGHNANATSDTGADNAVAIGLSAKAGGGNAVTIGVNTSAGENSITIGSESSAISGQNIAIGRYAKVDGYKVTKAVALGQKAEAQVTDGVAIGSNSIATVAGNSVEGYDPTTGQYSTDGTAIWKATKAAVSIGTADGKVTRQINGVAAGTNDTDAVNVAQLKKLEGMKANVDASNIGKNLKGADGKTAAADAEKTANEKAWGAALGTGDIATPKDMLVTDKAIHDELRPATDGTYVKGSQTTAENLSKLDAQVKTNADDISTNTTNITKNAGDITKLTNLSNITNEGQKVIKNLSKDAVKVTAGDRVTVTSTENKEAGTITYKVSANNDGTVAAGDQNLVSGDTVNTAITNAINNAGTATDTKLAGKANVDASNIGKNLKGADGKTAAADAEKTANEKAWGAALGTGDIATPKDMLVTDKAIHDELRPATDGTYVKGSQTTAENLSKLDAQVKTNADDISTNTTNITKNAGDITKLTNLSNITNEGQKVIKNLSKDAVKVTAGDRVTVTSTEDKEAGTITYKVSANNDGKVAAGDQNLVSGDTVNTAITNAITNAGTATDTKLAGKANVDASNIGANLKGADGKAASAEAQKANAEKWGSAIGTGEIKADDGRMVTGKTVYDEVRPKVDGSYVKKDKTTGENLSALDRKIGSMDKDGNYIKKDDSISENLSTLDTQVKKNADDITNINQSISTLDQNAVKYDDSNKSKVTLAGKEGTTITNVNDGALSEKSSDAVNGKQLYNEQKAREEADKAITEKVTNNTNEITKIKNGDFTDASKTAIHNIAKDAVKVVNGMNTTVTTVDGTNTTPTTYAVNVEGNGKVDSGDKGLISGGTLYNEVRPTEDGNYVKKDKTTGQNLSALDSGLKATSDLIHTNTAGDTIQIGGNSTATKIDVNGKDGKGRVITGVVSDANDPTSAANVGYVNGAYGRLNNNINKAAAGSNALAALHPLDYDPDDKADFAVGYGHYRNANAAAVGAFYHPNENTMVNVGVSLGNGDPGFNAGVSFKVGRGGAGHEAMSKTEMAKVINSQSKEIDALKKDNADKDKRIDALEQKMAEILAKLDKNGK